MSYYINKITFIGKEEKIEELNERLIEKRGMTVSFNSFDNMPEVIEVKDSSIYGSDYSDDLVFEMTLAAMDMPLARCFESEEFMLVANGLHLIEVKSYNPIDQIYVHNKKEIGKDDFYSVYMPNHVFANITECIEYFKAISEFVSYNKLKLIVKEFTKRNKNIILGEVLDNI